jgi:hypothetical protein
MLLLAVGGIMLLISLVGRFAGWTHGARVMWVSYALQVTFGGLIVLASRYLPAHHLPPLSTLRVPAERALMTAGVVLFLGSLLTMILHGPFPLWAVCYVGGFMFYFAGAWGEVAPRVR